MTQVVILKLLTTAQITLTITSEGYILRGTQTDRGHAEEKQDNRALEHRSKGKMKEGKSDQWKASYFL